ILLSVQQPSQTPRPEMLRRAGPLCKLWPVDDLSFFSLFFHFLRVLRRVEETDGEKTEEEAADMCFPGDARAAVGTRSEADHDVDGEPYGEEDDRSARTEDGAKRQNRAVEPRPAAPPVDPEIESRG